MPEKITSRTFYKGPAPAAEQARRCFDRAARLAKLFKMHLTHCEQCTQAEAHRMRPLNHCKAGNDLKMELYRAMTAGWYAIKEDERGRGQLTKTDFEEMLLPRLRAEIRRLYRADPHYKSAGEVIEEAGDTSRSGPPPTREPWKTNHRHFR